MSRNTTEPGGFLVTTTGKRGLVLKVHQHKYLGVMYSILINGIVVVIDESQVKAHQQDDKA